MELRSMTPTIKMPNDKFTGDVYMNSIFVGTTPSRLTAALVRFAPCARTFWHSHAVGQLLYVMDGEGLVATRDGKVIRMHPGDTVWTPPNEDHWHGGTAKNFMCHIAMLEGTGEGDPTTWLEQVTDEQYSAANADAQNASAIASAQNVSANAYAKNEYSENE